MVNRFAISVIVLIGITFAAHSQRSNVIAVFQLIEADKYKEAKEAVQTAIKHEKTRDWSRTWYAKGYLCQTAWEKGKKEDDKKKYELYPDQLYEAYGAYNTALALDKSGRLDNQIAPQYVKLANEFLKIGQKHYQDEEYEEALRAFKQALEINESPVLTVEIDTSLIYNAALAAYHVQKWDQASNYLQTLNEYKHSPNVSHLLFSLYLQNNDTIKAEEALYDGVSRYNYSEDLVLVLSNHLYKSGEPDRALVLLDSAMSNDTTNYTFPYTRGLIFQKSGRYNRAIKAYEKALSIEPEEVKIYVNIGTCYYNRGVEIKERARKITNNRRYLEERKKSNVAFRSAVSWLEKAREKDPDNTKLTGQLNELYKVIQLGEELDGN